MANQQAFGAETFIQSIGVNTHIDFYGGPYGNLATVEAALNYLGASNVRDSAFNANDIPAWQHVAQATGVKFDDFVGEVSPGDYATELSTMRQLASQGLLNAVEGANEPDAYYALSIGESTGAAAALQQQVWQVGQQTGLPVINTSFGFVDHYGSTGDLSAWTNYGNAHTYFGSGNNPGWANWIGTLNDHARSSAASRPVIMSETGYYTTGNGSDPHTISETVQAKYTLDLLLDGWQAGDARNYLYELLDQGTGDGDSEHNFGLFHSDGSAKPAATAVHNLIALLNDPGGAGLTGGSLDYTLNGLQSTDNTMLMQKSDGTFWLAVWNDTRLSGPQSPAEVSVAPHAVTLNLATAASNIQVFDPLTGTNAVQSASGSTFTFNVPDHPVLVEIGGTGTAPTLDASGGAVPPRVPTPPVQPSGQQIGAGDAMQVIVGDNNVVSASAGDHMIFLTGTANTLSATGGTESVQAYQGGNTITTGASADVIRYAGSNNTIDAGGGNNHLEDSGSNNTIVLPTAGQGYDDVFGWVTQNGDTFDLRPLLAQTSWDGQAGTIADFVHVGMVDNNAVISVDPTGTGGTSYAVATLYSSGPYDIGGLLSHAQA